MKVLVCGANGFVGRHVVQALEANGHEALRGGRRDAQVSMDFTRDTQIEPWLERLRGVDAVVNAVGVLRNSKRAPMQAIHADAPRALFDACAQLGVRRVIQISALGIQTGSTPYATTKRAADEHLLALTHAGQLAGVVLRPSIVFGQGGESTALFLNLARLPLLPLPRQAMAARVQPVRVQELAQVIAALLGASAGTNGSVNCTGPQALSLSAFIASLRAQRGQRPARLWAMPDGLTRASARAGDLLPLTPWCSQALALMAQDNAADPAAFEHLLGHPATHYSQLLGRLREPRPHR